MGKKQRSYFLGLVFVRRRRISCGLYGRKIASKRKTINIDRHNQELLTELHKVNPNIYFEITYNKDRSINLTFTAEGMIEIFPRQSIH